VLYLSSIGWPPEAVLPHRAPAHGAPAHHAHVHGAQVFGITALLPLLVALIALQLDETPVLRREGDAGGGGGGGPLQEFVGNTRAQGGLLWQTVAQRQL
jgi:hypothetical protein